MCGVTSAFDLCICLLSGGHHLLIRQPGLPSPAQPCPPQYPREPRQGAGWMHPGTGIELGCQQSSGI